MSYCAKGMTLLELVFVVAIVAILASIALPSYRNYAFRANRTEIRAALLGLATAQEKFYLQCNTYTTAVDQNQPTDCDTGNLLFPVTSERGYYRIDVTAANESEWTAEAKPTLGSSQLDDIKCQWFGLSSTGTKSARSSDNLDTTGECWGR